MGKSKSLVALDIGTHKTAVIVGELKNNELNIIGFKEVLTKGIDKGLVVKSFDVVETIKDVIEDTEGLIGYKIDSVLINIGGFHVVCGNEEEEIDFGDEPKTIQPEDVEALLDNLADSIETTEFEITHIIPKRYIIDDDNEVEDPIGLVARKLKGEFHLVLHKESDFINLRRVIENAGIRVLDIVANPIASAKSVLYEDEKNLGVAVIDIGAGTTDISVFIDGSIDYTGAIPIAGNQITMDIAHRFKISKDEAEAVKVDYGSALVSNAEESIIEVFQLGSDEPVQINQYELVDTIEARLSEIFELVRAKLERKNYLKKLKGGIILTGGVSNTPDIKQLAEMIFKTDVRIGKPKDYTGYADRLSKPDYATTLGILLYQKAQFDTKEISLFSLPTDATEIINYIKQVIERLKNLF